MTSHGLLAEIRRWLTDGALVEPPAAYDAGGVLELRPSRECCDVDLPPDSPDARICTFECTFCVRCVEDVLGGVCPNCGGDFTRRPVRPPAALARHPASTTRVHAPGCGGDVMRTGRPSRRGG